MKTGLFNIIVLLLISVSAVASDKALGANDISPVIIDYFFEPGCPDCLRVKNQIMPELNERFEGFYKLNRYDVGIESNVFTLVAYQKKLDITKNEPVCMIVDYKYVFNGFAKIKKGLFNRIDECAAQRMALGWTPPEPIAVKQVTEGGIGLVEDRVKKFTVPAVVTAGLIDGINPCAIGSLVFFMSLLAVSKVRGRGLLAMGISFCLASFITYTAIGFGLLRVLHLFSGFEKLQFYVKILMIAVLGLFAYLSFRDAYKYIQTGNPDDVSLQLPQNVKKKIHEIMRTGLGTGSLVSGGIFVGVIVTALESVCTGQVYVPTLVLVIRSGSAISKGWPLLLLYNLMFILPLVIVFILTYRGLKTETLIEWSKRNVVVSKILLGCFFLAMAVLIGAM
ncbi:cytochrome c biogenesis CcdA family protein [Verrucomicrobiota bacterium]